MTDFLGNELNIGDAVVYIQHSKSSSCYEKSNIVRFTEKCIVMENGKRKAADKVVKANYENNL